MTTFLGSKGANFFIPVVVLLGWIAGIPAARAQAPVHQQLYWTRLNLQYQVAPRWQVNADLENRRFWQPDKQQQALFQGQSIFTLREGLLLGSGVSLSWVYTTTKKGTLIVPEIRPIQFLVVSHPLTNRLRLQHRYRIDERFFRNHDGLRLTEGYRYNWRFAYQAQLNYSLRSIKPGTLVKLANDVMLNAGKNSPGIFDQYRFYTGFEYPVTSHWSAEAGYMYIYQQGRQNMLARDVFRLTLFGRFGGARFPR
ncbi:DUF2490 domain-containing protein [Telluribacter sp.]|uniref:DUF2490 domain-containing protein n=1 Tax=Telluribacter sp. TaxID=1978767 RepID=UPI002E105C23|nr:DUF2490 domain-containing protein [Telluribacter sp.]